MGNQEDPAVTTEAGQNLDAVVTRTIVHLRGSDEPDVKTDQITRKEQLGEIADHENRRRPQQAGLLNQGISTDSSCGDSDMWMFDQTNFTGNEICFYNAGTATLANYVRYEVLRLYPLLPIYYYWETATRSYEAGSESGYFSGACEFCEAPFNAWDAPGSVDSNTQNSYYLTLN